MEVSEAPGPVIGHTKAPRILLSCNQQLSARAVREGGFLYARKGAAMVTVEYMVRAALRRDTVMSRAMLRACGVPVPRALPRPGSIVEVDTFAGMAECFANHGSPMDGRA